jgi:hypothetical protein
VHIWLSGAGCSSPVIDILLADELHVYHEDVDADAIFSRQPHLSHVRRWPTNTRTIPTLNTGLSNIVTTMAAEDFVHGYGFIISESRDDIAHCLKIIFPYHEKLRNAVMGTMHIVVLIVIRSMRISVPEHSCMISCER